MARHNEQAGRTLAFRGRIALLGLLAVLVLAVGGCSRRKVSAAPAPAGGGLPPLSGEAETGLASWYGDPYHGRPTASGEVYDMNGYTAAHRTLPFNAWVRVTSLENNLFTTVRINDRGPFIEGRIIDLSRGAGQAINMIGSGTMLVRLEVVKLPETAAPAATGSVAGGGPGTFSVQVGAFTVEENALRLQQELAEEFGEVFVERYSGPDGTYYRVRVGRLHSYDEAEDLAFNLRGHPGVTSALVVRLN